MISLECTLFNLLIDLEVKKTKREMLSEAVGKNFGITSSNANVVKSWAEKYHLPQKELAIMWHKAESIAFKGNAGLVVNDTKSPGTKQKFGLTMNIFGSMVKKYYPQARAAVADVMTKKTKTNEPTEDLSTVLKNYKKDVSTWNAEKRKAHAAANGIKLKSAKKKKRRVAPRTGKKTEVPSEK